MVYRILVLVVIGSGLLACGTEPHDSPLSASSGVAKPDMDEPMSSTSKTDVSRTTGFKRSVNKVYGIKIPSGMAPAKGPERVVRFQGKPSVAQVVSLIREQILFEKEVREGQGYLFRSATAHKDYLKRDLAIRIFTQGDTTTLDIWKEHAYSKSLPETTSKVSSVPFGKPHRFHIDPQNVTAKRKERLTDAVRLMKKMERGEPLSDDEKKSSLFN